MWSRFRNLLILLTLPWLLAACAGLPALPTFGRSSQPADPLAVYRQAMAPSQRGLLDELPPLPDYRMDVQVDPAAPLVTGRLALTIPPEPDGSLLPEYFFRLYPNLNYYGGSMSVSLATVNGTGAPFDYHANDTAVRVVVPPNATQPGEAVTIGLQWRLRPPVWDDERYHLIGASGGVLALPVFYPMLAVRDADCPRRLAAGHQHVAGRLGLLAGRYLPGDGYRASQLRGCRHRLDSRCAGCAGAGAVDDEAAAQPAWRSWRMVSGPAREFAMFISDQYGLAETYANDVRVNSWYRLGDEALAARPPNTPPLRCASTISCLAPIPTPSWIWSPARWSSAAWSMPG